MFNVFTRLSNFVRNLRTFVRGGLSFFVGIWRRRTALPAENLFLRKQLALFREREKRAMPTTPRSVKKLECAEDKERMMVRFDEEEPSGAPVSVRDRDGESAISAAQ